MSKAEDKNFTKYKYRAINTYTSTEWLADGKKKYRKVFNRIEAGYIYCEFSFFNKLFDEEDWKAAIIIKCLKKTETGEEEICNMPVDRLVKKDENIVYIREGWGNIKEGVFWLRAQYRFVCFIDEKEVASHTFYVEDEDPVTDENNPFFELESIKLFEGNNTEDKKDRRTYYKTFSAKESRYVWAEFKLKNKLMHGWYGEFFINFYNDAGQFKGQTSEFLYISGNEKEFCSGWGSDSKGTWFKDKYTCELVFMDTLIAVMPFEVSENFEEGSIDFSNMRIGGGVSNIKKVPELNADNLNILIEKMDKLIGLTNVKQKIRDYIQYLNFIKLRKEKGFDESGKISLHAVLTGNPGTGKTTVAKQLGMIYKEMGLLTKGHVHEVDRSILVAEYIGQTAPKTKKAIEDARGGILFIDEAYALSRPGEDSKDFGKEVIEILLKEMSDGPGNLVVVVAGYPEEMKNFLNSNPGLKSRFNHYFHFDDYTPEEMMQIADLGWETRKLNIEEPAKEYLFTKFTQSYRDRDRTFGNARFVMSVVDEAKMNMGLRLMKSANMDSLTDDELSLVKTEDIQKIFAMGITKQLDLQIDEKLLKESLDELNQLVGLQNIKDEISELVKLVKYYKEIGKDVLNKFVLHSVFTGNPGTGKTTVARIFAKIFRALGILEKGHLVECDREGMVAGYSGQTAIKTAEIVDSALGGVLFIDEAYALAQGSNDSFGMEAINTLLKRMEDNRDDFVVIAAGYTDNMNEFLRTNPGLSSRFERSMHFNDYSPDELFRIAKNLFSKDGLKMDADAMEHVKNYISVLYEGRDKYFGNAREIRKLVAESVKNQHLRMASMESSKRTPDMIETVVFADVAEFRLENAINKNNSGGKIGFRSSK
jgi:SpoVK/Ycf46/Vps4 family AAA+-type ATPase